LQRVLIGLRTLLAGLWLSIGASILLVFYFVSGPMKASLLPDLSAFGAIAVCILILLMGIVVCTGRETSLESSARTRRIRKSTRSLAVAVEILIILFAVLGSQQRWQWLPVTQFGVGLAAAGLSVAFPMWLDELIQRASIGTPEASATVATWLGIAAFACVVAAFVSAWAGSPTGLGMATMALLPILLGYLGVLHLAIWRCTAAVAYDERLSHNRVRLSHGER
jgi:hypothetical protein